MVFKTMNTFASAVNSIASEYPGCEVRPFSAFLPLSKAVTDADGFRHVYGPVAAEGEDLDGETADQGHLWKGLMVHRDDYGGWVDYNHMYPVTGKEEYLIGRGTPFKAEGGRPFLDTRLIKGNPHADAVFNWAEQGMHAGYSVYGMGVRDGKIYKATCIQFVTCAPMPKGKTNLYLSTSAPAGSLVSVSKALSHDVSLVGVGEEWLGVQVFSDAVEEAMIQLRKAFTTGSGVVDAGATGGQALRSQFMAGSDTDGRRGRGKLQTASWDYADSVTTLRDSDEDKDSDETEDEKKKRKDLVVKSITGALHATRQFRHPEAIALRLVESGMIRVPGANPRS